MSSVIEPFRTGHRHSKQCHERRRRRLRPGPSREVLTLSLLRPRILLVHHLRRVLETEPSSSTPPDPSVGGVVQFLTVVLLVKVKHTHTSGLSPYSGSSHFPVVSSTGLYLTPDVYRCLSEGVSVVWVIAGFASGCPPTHLFSYHISMLPCAE